MRTKTSLLGAAGLSLMLGCGLTSAAHAATTSRDAELQELRAEVQALTARIDAQQASEQQTQATAQQAAAQAQAAQAAVDTSIKTIPASVQTAVAALPKPKEGWWSNTTISGRMYYDVTGIDQESNGANVAGGPNGVNFDIKRFYIGVDHKFNDTFSANVTTDFTYDSGISTTQVYLKKAYLQAKLSDALTVRLGSADLPWVPFVEDLYGYRYVENVMVDRDKFGTSADWGVHALGKFPMGPATISYQVSAIDGSGYKKPAIGTANRSKGIDLEGRVSANVSDFVVAVGGYSGKLGKDVEGVTTFNTAKRFDALAAYSGKRFKLGVEYFDANDWNDVTQANPLLTNNSKGYSVFGSAKFTSQFGVFGRYDWVKPKEDTSPTLKDNYFNVGVSYSPAKIVDFALVYKHDKVENGSIATSNGTIGGSVDGTYDELGLWSQFRW